MFLLTDRFEDKLEYKGNILTIDMSFDNILRVFELFDDVMFKAYEKIPITLEMLINEYEIIEELDFMEQFELYNFVLKEFLGIDNKKDSGNSKRMMDFSKDAGLIYSSFLSEYNIDLFEMQGKLHWKKFSELLSNLGDKTAFKKVIGYRTMKVPSTKEASQEYRKHIQEMKRLYSLDEVEEVKDNMEDKLDSIASTFGKGGKNKRN